MIQASNFGVTLGLAAIGIAWREARRALHHHRRDRDKRLPRRRYMVTHGSLVLGPLPVTPARRWHAICVLRCHAFRCLRCPGVDLRSGM
jgi:hypothetical protein